MYISIMKLKLDRTRGEILVGASTNYLHIRISEQMHSFIQNEL